MAGNQTNARQAAEAALKRAKDHQTSLKRNSGSTKRQLDDAASDVRSAQATYDSAKRAEDKALDKAGSRW